jgi:hypothetical protein
VTLLVALGIAVAKAVTSSSHAHGHAHAIDSPGNASIWTGGKSD